MNLSFEKYDVLNLFTLHVCVTFDDDIRFIK